MAVLLAGAAYVPGRRRRPRRAGPAGLRRGRRRRGHRRGPGGRGPRGQRPARERAEPDARRRRLGDLHVRLDRHPQGRRGHPPQRRGVRRRRVAAVPAGRAARTRRPGDGRAVRRLRRELRGDVAGLEVRRVPGAGAPSARAQRRRRRPWLVANQVTVVSTVPTLVSLWPDEALDRGPAADPRRRGLPARARRPAGPRPGREVWNTYGPTEATVVACGARLDRGGAGPDRPARWTAGTSPSSTPTGHRSPRARPAS